MFTIAFHPYARATKTQDAKRRREHQTKTTGRPGCEMGALHPHRPPIRLFGAPGQRSRHLHLLQGHIQQGHEDPAHHSKALPPRWLRTLHF
ncbi:hypothetical protein B0T16DRAFT_420558 [Cercophora newfieldiana]|uniref:Uncharacterized protein n=1 Tax=Cercophora newfieldiana TaxID=92897 RepID=A0AA40CLX0_9PEZI|nr:hypothetical protein B0T16DRAFT_420558 [Cercophora newfieldiana]